MKIYRLRKLFSTPKDAASLPEERRRRRRLDAALGGGLLLTVCDLASRLIFAPFELPLGVVLSLTGGPFFIWLLLKQRRGGGGL